MSHDRFTALVPMKEHSERVPGKNLRLLGGRPLCHWVLQSLSEANHVGTIVVNTDSDLIAREAEREFGAVIHVRPEAIQGDMVMMNTIIEYDLALLEGDLFLQTHSTNPLLRPETIDQAIERFLEPGAWDALFTVTPLYTRLYTVAGEPINHDPDNLIRTQDLSPVYEENSCLYLFTRSSFQEKKSRLGTNPRLLPIDREEAVDIDWESDFQLASMLAERRLPESRSD